MDLLPVSVPSKISDRPSTEIHDDKINSLDSSIQHSKSGYGNEWYDARPSQAVPINKTDKPYKSNSAFLNKLEHSLDSPGITVMKLMTKLVDDVADYQNYPLVKKSVRYNNEVAYELNKMIKKWAIQIMD